MAKDQDRSEQYIRQVADEIMEQIKAGVAPWQKPWEAGPFASCAAVAGAAGTWARRGSAQRGSNEAAIMIREENEGGEKYLTVENEDDFHEALKQGLPIEVTRELGEKIGLSFEEVGELGDIIEAHKDAYR